MPKNSTIVITTKGSIDPPLIIAVRGDKSSILFFISVHNVSIVAPGEAHTVVDHDEASCPEFPEAIKSIRALIKTGHINNPGHVTPLMAMSTTFTLPEQRNSTTSSDVSSTT